MIDLCRDDQRPRVGIQKGDYRLFDLLLRDDVTLADKHGSHYRLTALVAPFGWVGSAY
jgi:hypothetical protein